MNKTKILVIMFGGLGLAALLLGSAYAVYTLNSPSSALISRIELITVNSNGDEKNTYTVPLADDAKERPSNKFRLKNNSGIKGKYRLLLQETPIGAINDGCKVEDLMKKEDLKYELLKNGIVIKNGYLKDLSASILLETTIEPAITEEFELKTWIPLTNTTWMGKHFHYRISIVAAK